MKYSSKYEVTLKGEPFWKLWDFEDEGQLKPMNNEIWIAQFESCPNDYYIFLVRSNYVHLFTTKHTTSSLKKMGWDTFMEKHKPIYRSNKINAANRWQSIIERER